jgi:hypothetical protein
LSMPVLLSDDEIQRLINEPKPLTPNYRDRIHLKPKRGHKEAELDLEGVQGSAFRLILRQSMGNPLDFSVILAYCVPQTNVTFRLRRYNGKSHEHTNKLEGNRFYDFHIHQATRRYQEAGFGEDAYAEPTDRYADFQGALRCILANCGFELLPNSQPPLPSFSLQGGV